MKKLYATPIALALAVLLGACSSMPTSTSLLEQTRSDYRMAQANPDVNRYAPLELKQAGDALAQANASADHKDKPEKVDQLAYLAKQKIALAREAAVQKAAETEVVKAGKESDALRLQQRSNEADQAKANAIAAQQNALVAQGDAADAQRKTEEARRIAAEAQTRNAQLEAQLADLAAKKTERGMVITLGDVLFGTDQARLTPDGMRTAQKLADVLQQNPQRKVLVEGFTDSTGASGYNQELSDRRAGAVRTALAGMGIGSERVAIRGYGEAHPVAANDTAANRQLNRRVEIVLSDDSGKTIAR
ncbi:outer membrane protein OmpA-like peptidoglycan-associated protein [Rhodoferax ferrireducens]|uniref:Outer membrane protein OmpA-like peptidoglycan-associated protein n=1 Tax=Rhodoferax ferrireducens TaxID=192843 RepID=A0ABU2C4M7_9BURK|nr:OmpA family protein [Rhodoferax ferrireducens]MDR7376261.1 outer membrane protein OmpA-like peptidoglycan-associated protein [Rhodoferax ferrireducens]